MQAAAGRRAFAQGALPHLNVGGETVHRVVCYVDGVALIVERNHAQNRPEDLLPCDGMAAVVHVSEERRPDVVANLVPGRLSLTSRQQRGALLDAGPDEALHPVELRRVDEGADVRARHVGRSYLRAGRWAATNREAGRRAGGDLPAGQRGEPRRHAQR
eukprot:scaffold1895_cov123-Isochrysis_galbana.AAC.9